MKKPVSGGVIAEIENLVKVVGLDRKIETSSKCREAIRVVEGRRCKTQKVGRLE